MTTPITPDEAEQASYQTIPPFVVAAFNAEIAAAYSGGEAKVVQKKVVTRIEATIPDATTFDIRWLNVEELYRANGWSVTYDKPGYNETYDASFLFKRRKR